MGDDYLLHVITLCLRTRAIHPLVHPSQLELSILQGAGEYRIQCKSTTFESAPVGHALRRCARIPAGPWTMALFGEPVFARVLDWSQVVRDLMMGVRSSELPTIGVF